MVRMYNADCSAIDIKLSEVLRYMGCPKNTMDQEILNLAKKGIDELKGKMAYKACYKKYPVFISDEKIDLGFIKVKSKDLAKNLKTCKEIIVFVATIGIETDRMLSKYSLISPSYANTIQAVGAAAIESFCDALCIEFEKKEGKLCPRFSPGYGDLPIEVQKDILMALDSERKIGVHMTDSFLMLPTKSVSAMVGIK